MVAFYRRLKSTSFGLTVPCLTQAPHLGGLPRTSRLPFRDSCFTPVESPTGATSQRVVAHLIWATGVSLHSNLAPRGARTMTPPTLTRFINGLRISPCQPPTFMKMTSARSGRWRFPINPTRALRDPERGQGKPGDLSQPSSSTAVSCRRGWQPFQGGNPSGFVRCPIVQGVEAGGLFPVG
jgi:hypothetical protein